MAARLLLSSVLTVEGPAQAPRLESNPKAMTDALNCRGVMELSAYRTTTLTPQMDAEDRARCRQQTAAPPRGHRSRAKTYIAAQLRTRVRRYGSRSNELH